jgi:hypothetical protein
MITERSFSDFFFFFFLFLSVAHLKAKNMNQNDTTRRVKKGKVQK